MSEQWLQSEGNEDEGMSLLQLSDNELSEMQLVDDFVYEHIFERMKKPKSLSVQGICSKQRKEIPQISLTVIGWGQKVVKAGETELAIIY